MRDEPAFRYRGAPSPFGREHRRVFGFRAGDWSLEAGERRLRAKSDVHDWAAFGFSRLPLAASGTACSLTMVSTS